MTVMNIINVLIEDEVNPIAITKIIHELDNDPLALQEFVEKFIEQHNKIKTLTAENKQFKSRMFDDSEDVEDTTDDYSDEEFYEYDKKYGIGRRYSYIHGNVHNRLIEYCKSVGIITNCKSEMYKTYPLANIQSAAFKTWLKGEGVVDDSLKLTQKGMDEYKCRYKDGCKEGWLAIMFSQIVADRFYEYVLSNPKK